MIEYFCEDGAGDIFIANGIGPMLRWDGFASAFEEAGMIPPATLLVVGGAGAGPIVGEYFAFQRFVDAKGNWSDLSPISVSYTASGSTGSITGATSASPIEITSAAHGLNTGDTVKITGVGGNTGANGTFTITVTAANKFTLDDSHSSGSYDGSGTWISGVDSIEYTSVPVPTEAKVVRRQILRNTDGQAVTFYVDVDSVDLVATSFSSTLDDTLLAANEAVPLLDSENRPFANLHAKPLTYFPFLALHNDRMFSCGSVDYTKGHVKVTNGSTTVTGVGTDWKSTMNARFLYVSGATEIYEIDSVNETLQTLTLTAAYTSPTDKFAFYAIKPPPAYDRLISYSEPGKPQSWPAINAVSVQETGDRFTGLAVQGPFVYALESRHLHKLTFSVNPTIDGGVFMAASRGCVNNRCWIATDDTLYSLDELGIYAFSARSVEPLSLAIQGLFRAQDLQTNVLFRINWKRREFFHAVLDRQQEVIRWFVCLDGHRYPHDAICYGYRSQKTWIERFPFAITGAVTGDMGGLPQVYYGGPHSKIIAAWQGTLDLANPDLGDVRGTATLATLFTLTDSAAAFASVINSPLSIVSGKGKGQTRKIVEATTTELTIDRPWNILPDTTSVYQIGGVHWFYRTGWMRFAKAEKDTPRALELAWEPLEQDALADLRFIVDVADRFVLQAANRSAKDGDGAAAVKGEPELTIDLKWPDGVTRQLLPGHKEHHIRGRRYVQFELEGYSNTEKILVYQWIFEGVIADTE